MYRSLAYVHSTALSSNSTIGFDAVCFFVIHIETKPMLSFCGNRAAVDRAGRSESSLERASPSLAMQLTTKAGVADTDTLKRRFPLARRGGSLVRVIHNWWYLCSNSTSLAGASDQKTVGTIRAPTSSLSRLRLPVGLIGAVVAWQLLKLSRKVVQHTGCHLHGTVQPEMTLTTFFAVISNRKYQNIFYR